MECQYCSKICKNDNSLRNHERLCKSNPKAQVIKSNFVEYNRKKRELGLRGSNQYTKAKKLGLPKPEIKPETREKLSKARKGYKYTELDRLKKSEQMGKAVQNHPESYTCKNVSGRVKLIEYRGVKLKGTWEFLVAQWLDDQKLEWKYENTFFNYEWNGTRRYYPDFYIPKLDLYLEVKGFIRDRDLAKWKVVPKLKVITLKEINLIKLNKLGSLAHLV